MAKGKPETNWREYAGSKIGQIAPLLAFSDSELQRYLDIGLVKIGETGQTGAEEDTRTFVITFGNKVLTAQFSGNDLLSHDMQFLRGKNATETARNSEDDDR